MKRTLLAAALGGFITMFIGGASPQAAPIPVPKVAETSTKLVQTTGYYGQRHRHYRHRHWRDRPFVRWEHRYYAPRRYVRPHYRYVRPHYRHWTYRDYRRHYH